MKLNTVLRAGLQVAVCAVAFSATEIWNTKDPSVWTTEDANVILNKSPWAKQIKVGGQQQMRRQGMGRRGGMGYPGGGYPGGGYPGGGGGYPGGGGGYPGGGGGYPQGGGGGAPQMNAVVRWESAKPVQEAEARLKGGANAPAENPSDLRPGEAPPAQAGPKISGKPFANHYVITVVGLPAPGSRSRYNDDDNDSNSSRSNSDSSSGGLSRSARDQMMSSAQLIVKNGAVMSPDDIKLNPQSLDEIQFLFPKTTPLSLDDKEVTFRATIGKYKVENKFELKQMTRNKKLEVD